MASCFIFSCLVASLAAFLNPVLAAIDRASIVRSFNLQRTAEVSISSTNLTTVPSPYSLGNGNFAFDTDVTGLQTLLPYNTLSSWAWHNASLPTTPGQTSPNDFEGKQWWTHGRQIDYDMPDPERPDISNWLIQNPQRINLGRVGLWLGDNASEADIRDGEQVLDLYSGASTSTFNYGGNTVTVVTRVDVESDTIAVAIKSDLLALGKLGLFFDYPYSDVNKFDAPLVGNWTEVGKHKTSLALNGSRDAVIRHDMDATTYFTNLAWTSQARISGPLSESHRYILRPDNTSTFNVSINFAKTADKPPSVNAIAARVSVWWANYWQQGAFIDLGGSQNASATELQRRIILSQYLLAVNEAGKDPPQESGLVNNGWYGKFHLEMYWWHSGHWTLWNRWPLLQRSLSVYERFLPTSIQRASDQGYDGARLGKMSDPTGRSAPGEINALLIWQQPHAMYFAEMEYRAFPTQGTLTKWDQVLTLLADFMASFAFWNSSTGVYDLGPPMYPVSENTPPNSTMNPTFELAYWRFGLRIAIQWKQRQNQTAPSGWLHVADNLAPLPVVNGTYPIYEGIPNMWTDAVTVTDHPAMIGIYGLLPANASVVDSIVVANTARKIYETWDFNNLYGWDFPMLAMNAARLGNTEQAVELLLDSNFQFDEAGMPVGGSRVPTPYFPAADSLMSAVGMMAGGWDAGPERLAERWPPAWTVQAEGFAKAM